jgi:hypothetical protein
MESLGSTKKLCIDEFYLPKGNCIVPIQVVWTTIIVFFIWILFILVLGFPKRENIYNFGAGIALFANIFCASTVYSLIITQFFYFLIFEKSLEQLVIGLFIIAGIITSFFSWEAVIILNTCFKFLVTSYYLFSNGRTKPKKN